MNLDRQGDWFGGTAKSGIAAQFGPAGIRRAEQRAGRFVADARSALFDAMPASAVPVYGAGATGHAGGAELREAVFGVEPVSILPWQRLNRTPMLQIGSLHAIAKRAFDATAAAAALAVLSPLLLGVAAAIRLTSRGPALFTQDRYGQGSRTFKIYKFRTMHTASGDPSGVAQTKANDPRVTRLGRFLRRSNIDELPQLLNVVRGDMSLVGPRPHVPGMLAGGKLYEELVPYYFERHAVRPGLTGLAQVCGFRGPTDDPSAASARIDHDLAYVSEGSLPLDIRILWMTVQTEFWGGRGF